MEDKISFYLLKSVVFKEFSLNYNHLNKLIIFNYTSHRIIKNLFSIKKKIRESSIFP